MNSLLTISNYSEFKELYESAKTRIKKLDTNCLFPGSVVKDSIQQNHLYYREFPEGFILYIDEGNLYRIYYFLDSSKPVPELRCEKDLLLEELDFKNRREEYLSYFTDKILKSGFYLESRNIQFEINLAEQKEWIQAEYKKAGERLENNGLTSATELNPKQIEQVLELWRDHLKPTDVPVSHTEFASDDNQSVVCVLNKDGSVCGTLWWVDRGNYCEVRHIVTHPDYYRMGISNFTMLYSFVKAMERGSKFVISYTDIHNEKSIGMHKHAGMAENGKISLQFLLEADK